jgi:hypothetical protein
MSRERGRAPASIPTPGVDPECGAAQNRVDPVGLARREGAEVLPGERRAEGLIERDTASCDPSRYRDRGEVGRPHRDLACRLPRAVSAVPGSPLRLQAHKTALHSKPERIRRRRKRSRAVSAFSESPLRLQADEAALDSKPERSRRRRKRSGGRLPVSRWSGFGGPSRRRAELDMVSTHRGALDRERLDAAGPDKPCHSCRSRAADCPPADPVD